MWPLIPRANYQHYFSHQPGEKRNKAVKKKDEGHIERRIPLQNMEELQILCIFFT